MFCIKKLKKHIISTSTILTLLFASAAQAESLITEQTVIVYNWSEYIPEDVLDDFKKETGITVEYSTFDNNEIMYARLKALHGRGYDVIVPSTYYVSKLRNEGLIQAIDKRLLPNLRNMDPMIMNKSHDPGNQFSIPYLWGSTGIALNKKEFPNKTINSWIDLWDSTWRSQIMLSDDMREVFHIALKVNGHSTNTRVADEIKLAYERLRTLMPNIKMISGEPLSDLQEDKASIALMWNGDVAVVQQDNSKLEYIYPKEGFTVWVDSFVIPSRAKNVENAHKFINFMLRPDIAARCVEELGYATPSLAAKAILPLEIKSDVVIFPNAEIMTRAEFQEDVGEAEDIYRRYWNKLKAIQ